MKMKKLREIIRQQLLKQSPVAKAKQLLKQTYNDLENIISRVSISDVFYPSKINNDCKNRFLKYGQDLITLFPQSKSSLIQVNRQVANLFQVSYKARRPLNMNKIFDMYDEACGIEPYKI